VAGAALTYTIDSGPARGTLGSISQGTGTVTYTPVAGYTGTDSITYHASSSNGTSSTKTITLTVLPAPPPAGPTGPTPPSGPSAHPAAFRSLSMKARQHGKAITGSVIIAKGGSKFTGLVRLHRTTLGRRTARRLHAARYRFKITLSRAGLRTLHRRHALRLSVKLTVTGPGAKTKSVTRTVTLRA
jgi:hypothetical protein